MKSRHVVAWRQKAVDLYEEYYSLRLISKKLGMVGNEGDAQVTDKVQILPAELFLDASHTF